MKTHEVRTLQDFSPKDKPNEPQNTSSQIQQVEFVPLISIQGTHFVHFHARRLAAMAENYVFHELGGLPTASCVHRNS